MAARADCRSCSRFLSESVWVTMAHVARTFISEHVCLNAVRSSTSGRTGMSDPHGLCCYLLLYQQDFFHTIDLLQLDFDHFPHVRGPCASYECGFDWQLAVTAVN